LDLARVEPHQPWVWFDLAIPQLTKGRKKRRKNEKKRKCNKKMKKK